ncbi:MAG: type IX secretion system PorP/SprF family membrane protein [Salibacteraceae bacterium]|jgi:type IX secretion system PorP/SprF family membrane protein
MKVRSLHTLYLIGLLIVVIPLSGLTQDIHFSQFNQAPIRLNPALTGQFNGSYRIAGIFRSQWGSITVPYSTVAFSGDAQNFLKQEGLGVGIDFFYDKAGDGNLGTLQLNASGSYTLKIGSTQKNQLTGGFQLGGARKQIDPTYLVFTDQNGGGGTIENFELGKSYINLSTGLVWETKFENRKILQAGVAIHNLTQPNVNLYANDEKRLDLRLSIHANYQFKMSQKVDLIPGLLIMLQGPHQQITPGINGKYILDNRSHHYRAVYLGLWTRVGDAGFISMGMDWNTLNVGLSYDINYSSLQVASRYKGGFEVSLIYIFKESLPVRQFYKTCPDYL